jgi:hypothetical protein
MTALRVATPTAAAPAAVAVSALSGLALLHVRDPYVTGAYGTCPWLALTGAFCPGCGGLRALHDLTHGDVAGAASANLLVVVALLAGALVWLGWLRSRLAARPYRLPRRLALVLAATALVAVPVFTLLRNFEPTAWLAP